MRGGAAWGVLLLSDRASAAWMRGKVCVMVVYIVAGWKATAGDCCKRHPCMNMHHRAGCCCSG